MDEKRWFCSGCMDKLKIKEVQSMGPATMMWCDKEGCQKKKRQALRSWIVYANYIILECNSEVPSSGRMIENNE